MKKNVHMIMYKTKECTMAIYNRNNKRGGERETNNIYITKKEKREIIDLTFFNC